MKLVCPYCQGHAFVMVTASNGETITVCTTCNEPVPFEAPKSEDSKSGDVKPEKTA